MALTITEASMNEQEAREWAKTYVKEIAGTQSVLAQEVDMTASALNQFLKGTYPAPQTFVRKLNELRANAEDSQSLHRVGVYRPTSISADIYQTIRSVHLKGGLAVECGDPGIGKTMAACKYASDYANSAVVVTVNPAFATKRNFFRLLCRTCKLPQGPVDEMWYNCAEYFGASRKVLIVDEAQHLPAKVIDHIRSLADENPNLGIVFVGNRRLAETMSGRHETDYAQLISRTKIRRMRTTMHISRDDVSLIFPDVEKGHALAFLHGVAQSKQGLRGASNLYSNACDNKDITFDGLRAMAKHMQMQL